MTQDDQTGDQDGGGATADDTSTTIATDTSGSDASTGDTPSGGGSGDAGSGDGGSGASDAGSGDSGSTASSNDGGSGDAGAASGSSSDGGSSADAGASDQTPAADLTLASVQPASTDADSSISSSPSGSSTASTSGGSDDAVAADAQSGGGGGVSVGDLVTVGKAIASIMTASAPDYSMKTNPVSVLPQGTDPAALVGISASPRELSVLISASNGLGMEVCKLPIVVQWRYGGSIGGKGHYITNASAFLDSGTDLGVFYKGEITAALQNPFNAGSDPKDMLASVDVHIEVKVTDKISPGNLFVVLEGNIRGDGIGTLAERP
jgi:hypothetical protein